MNEQTLEIFIPSNKQPERIDKFLAREIAQISRTHLHKLIEENFILVNGQKVKPSHIVAPGEFIQITIPKPKKTKIEAQNIPLDILYEDQHLLVVNKPAGMVAHPALGHYDDTLVNALLFHCSDLSGIGGEMRPGIVHRLDKDTSGLLVVAKDDETHRNLSSQFSKRIASRTYLCIVWGHLNKTSDRIETAQGRNPKNRKKMAVVPSGKIAITNYKVMKEFPLLSLLEIKLETGRTHQIRVHMSYIGHPVFSDYDYGGRNRKLGSLSPKERKIAAQYLECLHRQALHAQTLGFIHPKTKERMTFRSSIPADMQNLLSLARSIPNYSV